MTTITAPLKTITLQALVPDLVRSCIVQQPSPPPDPGEEPPSPVTGPGIYTPVAPGVIYDNLPVVSIVDTSPDQMIGCIIDTADNPQGRLNALFPSAVDGDGVIERSTNDIWVFDGATWENVGPTLGPTIVTATVIPPWNEIVTYNGIVRSRVEVTSLPYALSLLTEPAAYGVLIGATTNRVIPKTSIAFAAHTPVVATELGLQIPAATLTLRARLPYVQNLRLSIPATALQLSAPLPYANRLQLQAPAATVTLSAHAPTVTTSINVAAITYSQSSIWTDTTAATNAAMTNGSFNDTVTGTDLDNPAWVRMDLGASTRVGSILVGTATSNIPGGWDKTYTEDKDLQYSDDGSSWTTATNTGTFASNGIYTFSVNFKARYIRIASTGSDYVAISEFYALAPGQTYP